MLRVVREKMGETAKEAMGWLVGSTRLFMPTRLAVADGF